jgi:carboxylesterase type B
MSGASGQNFDIGGKVVASNTAAVAESVGCIKGDANSAATLACLRDTPMQELEDASIKLARQLHPPFGEYGFYPQIDGDYIPKRPSTLYREGAIVQGRRSDPSWHPLLTNKSPGIPVIGSWTTNDGAWYVPPNLDGDDAIGASFKAFAVNMKPETLSRMVALYPSAMFEHLAAGHPQTTVDYYRGAQLHRDAWFTCPVIAFTWQLARHGNTNVRLYEMNATKFTPVMDTIGFPYWRVLHLSDIPYLLNNDIPGSAIPLNNSAEQVALSRRLSSSAIAFAYSGDPTIAPPGVPVLHDWPAAYSPLDAAGMQQEFPEKLSVQVLGGPHGSGPAEVWKAGRPNPSPRERAVHWERLLERCAFIDSVAEEIGV